MSAPRDLISRLNYEGIILVALTRSSDRARIQDFYWRLQLCRQWRFVRQSTEIGICQGISKLGPNRQ